MRLGLVGSPHDVHLKRWAGALARAGAEVLVFGAEPLPQMGKEEGAWLSKDPPVPYVVVGSPMTRPSLWGYLSRAKALRAALKHHRVELAHPIHLTPFGVWTYLSGFRPYVAFAMGADVLEYTPTPPTRPWLDTPSSLLSKFRIQVRRRLMPFLLGPAIDKSALCIGDNYTICEMIKILGKNKTKIFELPAGIDLAHALAPLPNPLLAQMEGNPFGWLLAPRGANQFYQADIILKGFSMYLNQGGRLGLILLGGLYNIDNKTKRILNSILEKFSKKVICVNKKLTPQQMAMLWGKVVGFISAPTYDGYSYAVAEGRAAGAVPILNAIPGNLEVATHLHDALIVHPFTPPQLASALLSLEKIWPDLRLKLAQYNRSWIMRFSNLEGHAKAFLTKTQNLL